MILVNPLMRGLGRLYLSQRYSSKSERNSAAGVTYSEAIVQYFSHDATEIPPSLNGYPLKLIDQFIYLGHNISVTKSLSPVVIHRKIGTPINWRQILVQHRIFLSNPPFFVSVYAKPTHYEKCQKTPSNFPPAFYYAKPQPTSQSMHMSSFLNENPDHFSFQYLCFT